MTMTVQERKRINKAKIMLGIITFLYCGAVIYLLYSYRINDYDSATNSYEDVQINSSDMYTKEPTFRDLQLKDIRERSVTFLDLSNEPNEIP